MNALLGVGGSYAVSAGLVVYAVEKAFLSDPDLWILGWAIAGLILAGISALRGK